jgi:thiol-disulfide isomerase/thioredoxin
MSVVGGLIVLVVVLVAASAAGFGLRARQGRFRPRQPQSHRPQSTALPEGTGPGEPAQQTAPNNALTAADLRAPLGQRATLVQFSTEFCTYCGPTREILAAVASERDGVAFVEIDAADRMDLTRRLRVMSTPTVLVLGADGAIESRSYGQPRKPDLLAAVGAVLGEGGGS